ncbi:hypothetical protein [Polynucleobacter antarcticus]|uniref:Uncharacterized protein n=1 Tax=Polynucleobacter antarcticus TaxID=1743162 RepID=A0A6M9PUG9_9BURK|nr:hypothetical protein [Polynucleobacter antarcticus]QKM62527.1 hypothetical protein DCO16_05270 [Polynucleobacter antarcticus]
MSSKLKIAALSVALAGLTAAPLAHSADTPVKAPTSSEPSNPCAPKKKKVTNPCGPANPCAPKKRKAAE